MAENRVTQRMAAILAADAVGFTRLMAADESATIGSLDAARAVFIEHIEANHGRVVDTAGDSVLAVFETIAGGVLAAVAIQRRLAEINEPAPDVRRMRFRIGIHLGDIHEKSDGTVYGDGVNIAARLESIASPGKIIVSDVVMGALRVRSDMSFTDAGEHEVKNVTEPVHAFSVDTDSGSQKGGVSAKRVMPPRGGFKLELSAGPFKLAFSAAIASSLLILVAVSIWPQYRFDSPQMVKADGKPTDDPVLAMPTGPTIAVLPFDNLSDDAEQQYFAEGLAADISRQLSRQPDLFVIGRATTSQYRSQDIDVRSLGQDLNVRFVVHGTVRLNAGNIRVSADLLSTIDGSSLWSSAYDRVLNSDNVFTLQDEITSQIVNTVADSYGVLPQIIRDNAERRDLPDLSSYECVLLGYRYFETISPDDHLKARDCLERTVKLDPKYADAWGWLAIIYAHEEAVGYNLKPDPLERALNAEQMATQANPDSQLAWEGLAAAHFFRHEFKQFDFAAKRTVSINPNDASTIANIGNYYSFWGKFDEGLPLMEKAMTLSPRHAFWYYWSFYWKAIEDRDFERALALIESGFAPGLGSSHALLASVLAHLGQLDRAKTEVNRAVEVWPWFPDAYWHFFDKWNLPRGIQITIANGLRDAGMLVSEPPKSTQ